MERAPYSSYWKGRPPDASAEAPSEWTPPRRRSGLQMLSKLSLVGMFFVILGLFAIPLITS
jgi:hypothetical protein